MSSHVSNAFMTYVEGSPQAAENPPHDALWRLAIASAMRGSRPSAREVGLEFDLEPGRVRIDLDNLVRLALDGLRDAGAVARGLVGVERIVATKRTQVPPGLRICLAWDVGPTDDDPFGGGADLVVMSDTVPREDSSREKMAWRDVVAAAWDLPPVAKSVGVDIAVSKRTSLAAMLKPVIDGFERYLGREPLGPGSLRPRDEQVTWLRVSRVPGLPWALRVRVGDAPRPGGEPNQPTFLAYRPDPDALRDLASDDPAQTERALLGHTVGWVPFRFVVGGVDLFATAGPLSVSVIEVGPTGASEVTTQPDAADHWWLAQPAFGFVTGLRAAIRELETASGSRMSLAGGPSDLRLDRDGDVIKVSHRSRTGSCSIDDLRVAVENLRSEMAGWLSATIPTLPSNPAWRDAFGDKQT